MKPLFVWTLVCLLFLSCHKKSSAPMSGFISTVAHGAAVGLATDNKGNVYFINFRAVFKVDPNGAVNIIAGCIDSEGFAGDGGPATNAAFNYATKIAVDGAGNIYIADGGNNRIRKVNTSGTIYTIAGTGVPGYTGDGGQATAACLNQPNGVAVDNDGNVFITEFKNHSVREIDASGVIRTIAGDGIEGFGGEGGPASAAQFSYPAGITIDKKNNIYVCDIYNHRIRKINAARIISTVAGDGGTAYEGDGVPATATAICPSVYGGVCIDDEGNVYFPDASNMRVRKINSAGIISTFAGNGYKVTFSGKSMGGYGGDGGPATNAELDWTYDVALDASGNIYIADYGNNRVRKVNR